MPLPSIQILAKAEGYSLEAKEVGQYHLIDDITGLPAVNLVKDTLTFTLEEALAYLTPLHGRGVPR